MIFFIIYTLQELVAEIINKTDMDNNKEVTYDEILPW